MVDRLVKTFSKGKVGYASRNGRSRDGLVEVVAKCQVAEAYGKDREFMIEGNTKSEVCDGGRKAMRRVIVSIRERKVGKRNKGFEHGAYRRRVCLVSLFDKDQRGKCWGRRRSLIESLGTNE